MNNDISAASAIQVLELAVEMRRFQKLYFKTRTNQSLDKSKALEAQFDKAAAALLNPGFV